MLRLSLLRLQVAFGLALGLTQVHAQEPDVSPRRVSVVYDVNVEGCPSSLEVRALLRSKLREDTELQTGPPFDFVVSVQEVQRQFAVTLSRRDGQPVRTLTDPSCTDALDAATTVLALLVDDEIRERADQTLRVQQQARREQEASTPVPLDTELPRNPHTVALPAPVAIEPAPSDRPFFQGSAMVGVGTVPAFGIGVEAGVGSLIGPFLTSLSLRYLANPGELNIAEVPVFLHTGGATAAFGVRFHWLEATALLRAGLLWANAREVSLPGVRELWTAGAGARVQATWSLDQFSVLVGVEILAQFVEISLMSGSRLLWRSAPVEGALMAGIRL